VRPAAAGPPGRQTLRTSRHLHRVPRRLRGDFELLKEGVEPGVEDQPFELRDELLVFRTQTVVRRPNLWEGVLEGVPHLLQGRVDRRVQGIAGRAVVPQRSERVVDGGEAQHDPVLRVHGGVDHGEADAHLRDLLQKDPAVDRLAVEAHQKSLAREEDEIAAVPQLLELTQILVLGLQRLENPEKPRSDFGAEHDALGGPVVGLHIVLVDHEEGLGGSGLEARPYAFPLIAPAEIEPVLRQDGQLEARAPPRRGVVRRPWGALRGLRSQPSPSPGTPLRDGFSSWVCTSKQDHTGAGRHRTGENGVRPACAAALITNRVRPSFISGRLAGAAS
jgi:hypothetical protein